MLESIIKTTKNELGKKLTENGVAADQLDGVLGLAQDTVSNNFKSSAAGGDLNSILNLFNGKQSIQGSSLVNNIISDYAGQLISKMGFPESSAKSVAGLAIPFIMNTINKKTPDSGLADNDLTSMLGNGILGGNKDNLIGKLKKLF